jgi:hypothetical protein
MLTMLCLGLTLVPSAHCQTQNIKIVSYSYYIDSAGDLDVVGEVQNVGSNTVNPIFLTGSVYSPDGVDQADSYTQVWVAYLTPQQEAPFLMTFPQPNNSPDGTWMSVDVSSIDLTVSEANATDSYQYPNLTITSSSGTVGNSGNFTGAYVVTGTIQNTGDQTAQNLTVVGAFYNSTGTVIAVGYTDYLTPASLAPSGTLSFQIAAFDLNQTQVSSSQKITSYSLLVQTEGPILQGTTPVTTSSPGTSSLVATSSPGASSSSTPSTTSSPSPGQTASNSTKPSNSPAIYVVVAIVIVVLAAIGAMLALRKRNSHMTVKEAKKARKKSMG